LLDFWTSEQHGRSEATTSNKQNQMEQNTHLHKKIGEIRLGNCDKLATKKIE
jgi:hypothetical protein